MSLNFWEHVDCLCEAHKSLEKECAEFRSENLNLRASLSNMLQIPQSLAHGENQSILRISEVLESVTHNGQHCADPETGSNVSNPTHMSSKEIIRKEAGSSTSSLLQDNSGLLEDNPYRMQMTSMPTSLVSLGDVAPVIDDDNSSNASSVSVKTQKTAVQRRNESRKHWKKIVRVLLGLGVEGNITYTLRSCWCPAAIDPALQGLLCTSLGNLSCQHANDSIVDVWRSLQHKGVLFMGMVSVTTSVFKSMTTARSEFRRLRHSYILNPTSPIRICWNSIALLCILYDFVMISIIVFEVESSNVGRIIDWFLRVFWIMDIIVSFRTGFYRESRYARYESSPTAIAHRYIRSWFAIDLIAAIPDWLITFLEAGSDDVGIYSGSLRWLKLFKVLRLIKFPKFLCFINIAERSNEIRMTALLLKYSLLLVLWIHVCGCAWYGVAKGAKESWIVKYKFSHEEWPRIYLISIQWALAQLQGSTDIFSVSPIERFINVCVVLMSIFILAIFISKITNLLIQLQAALDARTRHLTALREYMQRHKVATKVADEVRRFALHKLNLDRKLELHENDVLEFLPHTLRRSLLVEVRGPMIKRGNPFFLALHQTRPKSFVKLCCDVLESVFEAPDTLVYGYAARCNCTYVTVAGETMYDHVNNAVLSNWLQNFSDVRKKSMSRPSSKSRNSDLSKKFTEGLSKKFTEMSSDDCDESYREDLAQLESNQFKSEVDKFASPSWSSDQVDSGIMPSGTPKSKASGIFDKKFFRERLQETGSILHPQRLDSTRALCEAALWTTWFQMGDLTTLSQAAFLCLSSERFSMLVEHDPSLQHFGVNHATRFCRVLNGHVPVSDLLTSNDVLCILRDFGEVLEP